MQLKISCQPKFFSHLMNNTVDNFVKSCVIDCTAIHPLLFTLLIFRGKKTEHCCHFSQGTSDLMKTPVAQKAAAAAKPTSGKKSPTKRAAPAAAVAATTPTPAASPPKRARRAAKAASPKKKVAAKSPAKKRTASPEKKAASPAKKSKVSIRHPSSKARE